MTAKAPTARQLAIELGEDSANQHVVHMIECGLHSGFPKCCIAFFVKVWWPWLLAIDQLSTRARASAMPAFNTYQKWNGQPGYVPCPRCAIEKSFVKVIPCNCEEQIKREVRPRGSRR
jgi:hypothetical protein